MKMLSKNFSSVEFQCRCGCGQSIIIPELVDMMQALRDRLGSQIIVHCVNRCPDHNKNVGGVENSRHLYGEACDFHAKHYTIPELHAIVLSSEDILTGGIGVYNWGIHVDVGRKRQWDKRKNA